MTEAMKRSSITPTKLSGQDYARTVAGHLKEFEGLVPRVYTDTKGIPTMGAGVALVVEGKDGKYILRDLAAIGREINPSKPHIFTPQERKLLDAVTAKLNAPGLDGRTGTAEAKKLIPPYNQKTETPDKNKFGFTLSDDRMVKQAEAKWDEHRDRAFKVVRTQAQARGWSKEQTDSYLDSLKGSKEEVALISLAYNNVDAPKAVGAMLDGDPVTMRKEILYRSNGDKTTGHARRRAAEADLAAGSPENWPEQSRSQWQAFEGSQEARTYRTTYPDAFPSRPAQSPRTLSGSATIQSGDTLSKIAARHGVSVEDLAKANGITDPNRIRAGQNLTIPGQTKDHAAPPAAPPIGADEAHKLQMPLGDFLKGKTDDIRANGSGLGEGVQIASGDAAGLAAEAAQGQEQNMPIDPRAASLVEMASAPIDNPGRSALLKPVETLTESEMRDMIASAQVDYRGWRSGDPLKAHTYEKVQDWHAAIYGDGPQASDGGKPAEAVPVRPIPERPSPHATPDGEDLWQATARIGRKVAESGAIDGFDHAVKGLQRGLNILGEANSLPARSPAYGPYTKLGPVTEDGKYGPQTDFALKHATARLGAAKVDEAFALGRFNTFARQAQMTGNVDGLEKRTHTVFGPLFRDPLDDKAPKVEGGVFQETLNRIGGRRYDDWTPLKVDDWIGPKTTAAFGRVLRDEDADSLTSAFGKGLGLL